MKVVRMKKSTPIWWVRMSVLKVKITFVRTGGRMRDSGPQFLHKRRPFCLTPDDNHHSRLQFWFGHWREERGSTSLDLSWVVPPPGPRRYPCDALLKGSAFLLPSLPCGEFPLMATHICCVLSNVFMCWFATSFLLCKDSSVITTLTPVRSRWWRSWRRAWLSGNDVSFYSEKQTDNFGPAFHGDWFHATAIESIFCTVSMS